MSITTSFQTYLLMKHFLLLTSAIFFIGVINTQSPYKEKDKNFGSILHEISIFKKIISNKGNFNLQKENFLLKVVKIYEG